MRVHTMVSGVHGPPNLPPHDLLHTPHLDLAEPTRLPRDGGVVAQVCEGALGVEVEQQRGAYAVLLVLGGVQLVHQCDVAAQVWSESAVHGQHRVRLGQQGGHGALHAGQTAHLGLEWGRVLVFIFILILIFRVLLLYVVVLAHIHAPLEVGPEELRHWLAQVRLWHILLFFDHRGATRGVRGAVTRGYGGSLGRGLVLVLVLVLPLSQRVALHCFRDAAVLLSLLQFVPQLDPGQLPCLLFLLLLGLQQQTPLGVRGTPQGRPLTE
mmetsp:Transcript_32526/g.71567  ORF Transcript_32526/g.71567 Transcript_32526/m.71567 type:complete len:267 (+) Transcript_32526:2384-3184(+)